MLILGRCIQQRVFVGKKITVTMGFVDKLFVDIIVDIEGENAERLEWRLFLGKTLAITESITVTLLKTHGPQARLGFDAPVDVMILREEVCNK